VSRYVLVKAMKAFNNHSKGEAFHALMNESLAHLIVNHYLELLEDPNWRLCVSASSPCDGSAPRPQQI
jgi:hypothetical protein